MSEAQDRKNILEERKESYVDALQRELEGYVLSGKTTRAEEVKKELARIKKAGRVTPVGEDDAVVETEDARASADAAEKTGKTAKA